MAENQFLNDPTIVKEFVAEFKEHLQALELNMLELEKDPGRLEILNEIFRPVHTLKGAANFLGFEAIGSFSHELENLLDDLRKGKRSADQAVIDLLLMCLDILKKLIADVSKGGDGSSVDTADAVAKILELSGKAVVKPAAPAAAAAEAPRQEEKSQADLEVYLVTMQQHLKSMKKSLDETDKGEPHAKIVDNLFRAVHSLKASTEYMKFAEFLKAIKSQEEILGAVRTGEIEFSADIRDVCGDFYGLCASQYDKIKESGKEGADCGPVTAKQEAVKKASGKLSGKASPDAGQQEKAKAAEYGEDTVRVTMKKLDQLMNLVGELIIEKSRMDMLGFRMEGAAEIDTIVKDYRTFNASLGRIADDLHTAVMNTRMVAIGGLFNRFPRVVRELCKKKNKEIELVMEGEDTEIDKTIIEEINDPLLHLIRNSADHGVEDAETRKAAGKPEKGKVTLRASHESGSVIIEVEDDGGGINTAKVKEKALKNGLITQEQAEAMKETELLNLIFMPGFSTAEVVTDISGRGVGMDVVKTNIEKLRGKIIVKTELGKGTKITLKLPLTMAIIETLMVKVGSETYALPLLSVRAVANIKTSSIHTIKGREVVVFQDKTLNAAWLGDVFNIGRPQVNGKACLVVVHASNTKGEQIEAGFFVDSFEDKQKIVIKPLDDDILRAKGFSGVTILGNGNAALIIDPVELIEMMQ